MQLGAEISGANAISVVIDAAASGRAGPWRPFQTTPPGERPGACSSDGSQRSRYAGHFHQISRTQAAGFSQQTENLPEAGGESSLQLTIDWSCQQREANAPSGLVVEGSARPARRISSNIRRMPPPSS